MLLQVHLAYGLPAGAVTYIDEEGDTVSLDSEGERKGEREGEREEEDGRGGVGGDSASERKRSGCVTLHSAKKPDYQIHFVMMHSAYTHYTLHNNCIYFYSM